MQRWNERLPPCDAEDCEGEPNEISAIPDGIKVPKWLMLHHVKKNGSK
jgi:hypothetical protein